MYICVILRQRQKTLVPCERNITSDTVKGFILINQSGFSQQICSINTEAGVPRFFVKMVFLTVLKNSQEYICV